jgi:hypothetical protein
MGQPAANEHAFVRIGVAAVELIAAAPQLGAARVARTIATL